MNDFIKQRFNHTILLLSFGIVFLISGCRSSKEVVKPVSDSSKVDLPVFQNAEASNNKEKERDNYLGYTTIADSLNNGIPITMNVDGIDFFYTKAANVPEIVSKVFPKVVYASFSATIYTNSKYLTAFIGNNNYDPCLFFNKLYSQMGHQEDIEIFDRINALVQIFIGFENEVKIQSINMVDEKTDNYSFNYEVNTTISNVENKYLILFQDNEFRLIYDQTTKKIFKIL